jgi:hypothetical protein
MPVNERTVPDLSATRTRLSVLARVGTTQVHFNRRLIFLGTGMTFGSALAQGRAAQFANNALGPYL